MTTIKTIKILVLMLSTLSIAKAQTEDKDNCALQYKVEDMPKSIKKEIKHHFKKRMVLANPKEKFQATDIINGRMLKERRLVFWASCDNTFYLVYEHGGYAYHKHLIQFRLQDGSYRVNKNIGPGKSSSLEELNAVLKEEDRLELDHF